MYVGANVNGGHANNSWSGNATIHDVINLIKVCNKLNSRKIKHIRQLETLPVHLGVGAEVWGGRMWVRGGISICC